MSSQSRNSSPPHDEVEAAEEFGYQPELKRGTGRFASFAVVFAFVSIATGTLTVLASGVVGFIFLVVVTMLRATRSNWRSRPPESPTSSAGFWDPGSATPCSSWPFSLFSAATLPPAVIDAAVVLLYMIKRKHLPSSQGFTLGRFEIPVIVVAAVWLVFELSIFGDESFGKSWIYVAIMVALGGVYLVYLLISRGGAKNLAMPDLHSIDHDLETNTDAKATAHEGSEGA